jgi:hypothetical protein
VSTGDFACEGVREGPFWPRCRGFPVLSNYPIVRSEAWRR